MQGIPSGFALTALANYLTAEGISSSTVGSFIAIIGIPWIVQLIWGPLIDRYRYSVVGHYKHWIILTQVAAFIASLLLLLVKQPATQVWLLAGLFFMHSVVASVQDASVDAMAILITPANQQGRVNAFMRGGILLGISFGAAGLSFVLHRYNFTTAVLVQSGILLLLTVVFFFTKLYQTDPLFPVFKRRVAKAATAIHASSISSIFRHLTKAIFNKQQLRIFSIIWLSYVCFSIFVRSINFYLIRSLAWSDQELSVLTGGWGALVTLSVILMSGLFADKLGATRLQRYILLALSIFLVFYNLILFSSTSKSFITSGLLFWGVADPLYSIAAFPILMNICDKEIAGSQFTAYMALINLADIGGAYLSGWLLLWLPGPLLGFCSGIILFLLTIILFRFKLLLVPLQAPVVKDLYN